MEIAALVAPKPLMIVSDGSDWTLNTPEVEYPHIKRIYSFFDATDNVAYSHFADEGHDYGPSKRAAATISRASLSPARSWLRSQLLANSL